MKATKILQEYKKFVAYYSEYAERAEAIEAAAMKIRREAAGAKIYTYKEL